jgi:Na+/melibiose symporter-like transporter
VVVAGGVLGGLVGSVVLLDSILTDVVNLDNLHSGIYRSGIYFGLWRFVSKVSRGVAFFGTGALLSAVGFQANQDQSEEVLNFLGWIYGPGVGLFLLIAVVMMLPYRYTDAKQRQVQRLLLEKYP